ncbi:hypothetical protein KBY93_13590 [Synechococcus sp. J7-Johnson]|uniref:SLOG cluster 4 domain-containing protein n=1 Tax=Synechococcus sp. J7-Johnson TaxID=2823737 RepID=UPI0020CFD255|nr:hypothetical protein [Synechococcus sp. J7-Johnson]MCP9841655.1 hypothetical protein [Synechococcus sp. J7-Johnson]
MSKRPVVVGVMGAGEGASAEAVDLAEQLGECISARGWVLLTGGRSVGVLPDEGNGEERQCTADLDLAVFTGMGKARNVINVLSSDVVVVYVEKAPAVVRVSIS